MSVKSTHENDSILNHSSTKYYPDIVYTLEPTIQHFIRLLRIIRWKKGYTHQSIVLTLIWTFFWFHTLIVSYTIPIWIVLILYHSFFDQQQQKKKETTIDSFEKLTVELKEIQLELSLILPSPESKDRFRQWCRRRSLFVLGSSYYYQSFLFITSYAVWIGLLNVVGADKIIWFLGCMILTWDSSLFKVIRYSYHRAAFILKQQKPSKKTIETTTNSNNMATSKHHDYFDHYYHFVVIEHQRWWLHRGWASLLLPNERPEWSDEYLSKVPSIEQFHLPPPTTRIVNHRIIKTSWEWISQDWEIDENHYVDKDGWEYGSWDWTSWSTKSSGLRVLTRRRHWVRNARLVEEEQKEEDNQSITTTATTPTMAIPIIMKKTNTCTSLSTSLSSEDSFLCSTPTATPPNILLSHSKSSSTSTISLNHHHSVEPSIFSDHHSTVDSQLWLRR